MAVDPLPAERHEQACTGDVARVDRGARERGDCRRFEEPAAGGGQEFIERDRWRHAATCGRFGPL
jgi:hypothetical protein